MGFPETLTRVRKARGLSQENLAVKIGVSRQAVSKWETGDAAPDMTKLLALADTLELNLDALCGREPAAHAPVEDVPAASTRRKTVWWLLPALCGFLAAGLLAGGLWGWYRHRLGFTQAEEAMAYTTLPEEFTVSGVSFTPPSNSGRAVLNYCFTPSSSSEEWTYQVTFTTGSGISRTVDSVCEGGVCTGDIFLAKGESYTVTASVVDEAGNSRNTVIAMDLSFFPGQASWTPIEE